VYALPALAIEMVEESSQAGTEDDADMAIASLALAAPQKDKMGGSEDSAKEIRAKIRSPEIRRFIDEASIKIRDTSAREILAQVEHIDSAERKLFFLRRWAVQNRRRPAAADVLEAALAIAIRAPEYTPNARDMRQLATPLPYVDNPARLHHLAGVFAANKANTECTHCFGNWKEAHQRTHPT